MTRFGTHSRRIAVRRPEPWYWTARKGWYVQIEGKQRLLGKDPSPRMNKAGEPVPPDAVSRAYYRMMAAGGMVDERDRLGLTVAEAADLFLESKAGLRKTTLDLAKFFVQRFVNGVTANRRLCDVKVGDVERVAESYADRWSPSTRGNFVSHVGGLFAWAMKCGYLVMNPIGGYKPRYPEAARTRGMTDAEFWSLVDKAGDVEFKQVMQFLRATGCRPGEARAVEAAHVHLVRPWIVLPADLHKSGGRTGKPRIIRMPKETEDMVRALCAKHPNGPIFRNSRNGGPWSKTALINRVRRYRRQLGLGEDVVPYLLRHAAVTRLLDGGTDIARAAKIVGHAGVDVTQRIYYHPDEALIMEDMERSYLAGKRPKEG